MCASKLGIKLSHLVKHKEHYRPQLIKMADEIREKDPDYFTKIVADQIAEKMNRDCLFIITDFRNMSEYEYIKKICDDVIIVHVEHVGGPVPPMDFPIEHNLDDFPTDICLKSKDKDTSLSV